MIEIIGVSDWESVIALRAAVRGMEGDLRVCWGTLREHPGALNGMRRVGGYEQLGRFLAAGLNCPTHTNELNIAVQWALLGGVGSVWGREHAHTKGRDIVVFGKKGWDAKEFWVLPVGDVRREWRFHIFGGRSIKRELKIFERNPWIEGPSGSEEVWRIDYSTEPPETMRDAARRAVTAVGYDFGAVDVLEDRSGRPWVLEVNRAPWLGESTVEAYARAIERVARG